MELAISLSTLRTSPHILSCACCAIGQELAAKVSANINITEINAVEKLQLIVKAFRNERFAICWKELTSNGFVVKDVKAYVLAVNMSSVLVTVFKLEGPERVERWMVYAYNHRTGAEVVALGDPQGWSCVCCAGSIALCISLCWRCDNAGLYSLFTFDALYNCTVLFMLLLLLNR